ncbi:MAG: UvrD-helicase domain-containing protein [Treponema sp.]|jgi:ATP-dependent helicase/nuclease subunit A|nr:UvrD-helicase domain-containing protein [Treponema sp.]
MSVETLLAELDPEQRKAATAEFNAVVTAGAGSGKTKVLASRYAWLVMEKGCRVDQILTLTFTNKAVNEMYSRIYTLLAEQQDNPRAREAVGEFYQAHILTLDAFSAGIARTAAPRYGISPDFASDTQAVRELALEAALPFVLAHRDNEALQILMANRKIRTVAEELFAETVLRYSPISRPLDYKTFILRQHEEILEQWCRKSAEVQDLTVFIGEELDRVSKKTGSLYEKLRDLFQTPPDSPDIKPLLGDSDTASLRRELAAYFAWLHALKSVSLSGKHADEFIPIKDSIKALRGKKSRAGLYGELGSLANIALQSGIAEAVFPLVEEFQQQFNRQKRESGLLTFNDIAHLAVDALAQYPDIRQVYKDTFRYVMVDEFQDNNGLQRDLIFLLAENPGRSAQGIPGPEEIRDNMMFFVGDEKQSIYRFRGADVSVFRSLAKTLGTGDGGGTLNLSRNYRSKPVLIDAFNRIFGPADNGPEALSRGSVFLREDGDLPLFEAAYHRVYAPGGSPGEDPGEAPLEKSLQPQVHFCFLDKGQIPKDDPQGLSAYELEAACIAAKIRELVDSGYMVRERDPDGVRERPCVYGDFAVLQRSYSHQHILENQCKNFGIPFNAEKPAGIFSDAPVNDLLMFLRLLVYPGDRLAYGALIRSPFMRLSDLTLSVCLLSDSAVPFDEALEEVIPPEDRELFSMARSRYRALAEDARTLPVAELLTKLWYDEGYRYETTWSPASQIYGELFDLVFELARETTAGAKAWRNFWIT